MRGNMFAIVVAISVTGASFHAPVAFAAPSGGQYDQQDQPAGNDKADSEKAERKRSGKKGCIVGSVVGGLLGAVVGKKLGLGAGGGALLGASLGCAAGWSLGKALKGKDSDRLNDRVSQLASAPGAQKEVWYAPESGAPITIETDGKTYEDKKEVEFTIAEGIASPPVGVYVVGRKMRATQALRLRSSPSTEGVENIVRTFDQNAIVEVLGNTPDSQWSLIGVDGVGVGYASHAYLSDDLTIPPPPKPVRMASSKAKGKSQPKAKPAPVAAPAPALVQAPAPRAPATVVRVMASTQCKVYTASAATGTGKQSRCALPNSAWA